jgi:hypothetical protein
VVCDPKFPSPKRRSANDIRPQLIDYLDHLRMTGGSLPGRLDSGLTSADGGHTDRRISALSCAKAG